jgi:hypothetical protein
MLMRYIGKGIGHFKQEIGQTGAGEGEGEGEGEGGKGGEEGEGEGGEGEGGEGEGENGGRDDGIEGIDDESDIGGAGLNSDEGSDLDDSVTYESDCFEDF